jgi:hypothetical protein
MALCEIFRRLKSFTGPPFYCGHFGSTSGAQTALYTHGPAYSLSKKRISLGGLDEGNVGVDTSQRAPTGPKWVKTG